MALELDKYLKSSKKEKGLILDSLVRQTGMWRESIIRSLRREQLKSYDLPLKKRGRSVYYTHDVCLALEYVWKAANSCCGELLHSVIPEYVSIFRRDKMWQHNDEVTGKLLAMKKKLNSWK